MDMNVLIIDDSSIARRIAQARLVKENLDVDVASNGEEGLAAARRNPPDLILLDVNMPDLDGFEVCKSLKNDPDLSMIPVIFLTGSDDMDDRVKGLDLGAVDYVTKPFDAFELRARVRAALRTKHLQDMLINSARMDPLTELPNRRALTERLEHEWERVQRYGGVFALIMADIDLFKRVNDTYGHSAGDTVLREVAQTILNQSRKTDHPTRFGGEEFAIVVPNESVETAASQAERLRREIETIALDVNAVTVRVTMSFGLADSSAAESIEELLHAADEALYHAKHDGRNCVRLANATPADA
jgi:diguanylate cyclase (GGDEF)-like protein